MTAAVKADCNKLRVLQVGYGAFGPVHATAWMRHGFGDRLAIVDPSSEARARAARDVPQAHIVSGPVEIAGAVNIVDIVSPAEQETLWNIGATLNLQVRFEPALQPGHRFDVLLDGEPRTLNSTSGRVTLPNVFRGTHTLQIVVSDGSGIELMRSPMRTFHVQQTSIRNPNNPNANRPGR